MSLVQELADQLRSARDELPVMEVAGAAERLRTATGLLAWVMHHSARDKQNAAPSLAIAAGHLDHAAAALRVAQDAIDEYALALGMPIDAYPATPVIPTQPGKAMPAQDARLADWWGKRVAELTGGDPDIDRADGAESTEELLHRCLRAALDQSTGALHKHLTKAGPGIGLGLAAIAPSLLRHLAQELVGHPPRLEDLARVRRAALPLVAEVLPELPGETSEEILARVCHAHKQRPSGRQPGHPVDVAAASVLLVAGLWRANGHDPSALTEVLAAERQATAAARQRANERADAHRAALRITDTSRRHTAVDELQRPTSPRSGG